MNREMNIPNFVTIKPYESENLRKIVMKYEFFNNKTKYLQKLINKLLDEREKWFSYDFSECK